MDDGQPVTDSVERDALLRERGYDPSELSRKEQDEILADILDTDDDNDRLGEITPSDEKDGNDV